MRDPADQLQSQHFQAICSGREVGLGEVQLQGAIDRWGMRRALTAEQFC
jgi:hypothetical protein